MSRILLLIAFIISFFNSSAQSNGIISGPWAGNVELRNATIWVEVTPAVKQVAVRFSAQSPDKQLSGPESGTVYYKGTLGNEFNPVKIELNGLKMNTTYNYTILINGKAVGFTYPTVFKTKDLWQWRKPAPDFSFLTGSCAYFNEPEFDRPGTPYGNDTTIFETMANTAADFSIWMGDNWYTREVDYYTNWGMYYRASHDRSTRILQKYFASKPQYAIWDDHDFGPNDGNSSFVLKETSRKVFMDYWLNPSYGEDGKGIYTKFTYADADFFLLDDRYFRDSDNLPDSVNGMPNPNKTMYGKKQLDWLENALLTSSAPFKIIVTGSQVLNAFSPFDCVRSFPIDYDRIMNMLSRNRINGVLFFTGDRHHSEIIKQERNGTYALYDVTVSPFTASVAKARGDEQNNPTREKGTLVEAQNFAKVTISGKNRQRVLKVDFIGIKGELLGSWSVNENQLRTPSR